MTGYVRSGLCVRKTHHRSDRRLGAGGGGRTKLCPVSALRATSSPASSRENADTARHNPARAQRWRNSLPTSSFASPSIKWRGDAAQLPRRDERPGAPAAPLDKWSLVTLVDRELHGARERALVGARLGGTCIDEGAICEFKARYVFMIGVGRPSGVAARVMRARGEGCSERSGAGPLLHVFHELLHMLQAMPANIKLWPR